ncbi:hypothetical protein BCR34DRAFT_605720 [Clohesyomyces aquaticus]|uniref:Uncharacterized protein n=1 Tax=Clohesyomyces aquaticus TaxID=1231657 RepID=A0A1Y1YVT9_9PLEO|nr:hypothetical protein BCR34DRAFT_605720 [Clohesyomyces aquaticus]
MVGPRYTVEQLQHLRSSPLVQKPDGLPNIEQWMETPADQNNNATTANRRPRSGPVRDSDISLGGEARSDRPLFSNAGMGNFGRRPSAQPEDTVLGPPKLSFTSASRNAKVAAENAEKRTLPAADGDTLGDRFSARERWTRDERTRDKPGYTNGRRNAREDGESGWTNVKARKSLGQEDFDRGFGRNNDRDREKPQKEGDGDNDTTSRRTNVTREKPESRWGRREESATKESEGNRFTSGQGGWRDRERDRGGDRDRDREWNRGAQKVEEDPEWMDTKAPGDKKQAKTQEDFQRWKEQMRAKDAPAEEKEDVKEPPSTISAPQPLIETSIPTTFSPAPSKQMTPLGLDPSRDGFFGNWGKEKAQELNAPQPTVAAKKAKAKSKFAGMFAKPEEPANPPPLPALESPAPGANGSNDEDKQGFQRILQMLGGATISGPGPQPPSGVPLNGNRQGGGISLDLFQTSQPEEPSEMRQLPGQRIPRTAEQQSMLENILAPRPSAPESRPSQARFSTMSPEANFFEQYGLPRQDSGHPVDDFPTQQPPPRNSSAQEAQLNALLKRQQRDQSNQDQAKQQFLLNLMQPTRVTPPQGMPQNLPRSAQENQNLQAIFEQSAQRQQGQPRGRGLPPGFMDDPRLYADPELAMRRDAERREVERREAASFRAMEEARRREQHQREALLEQQQQEAMRKNNPRLPPSMYDDPALAGLQRRNTQGEIPRQMTNMGIPSQPVPDMAYMRGNPGMPPTPQDRNIAPPPGFGAPVGMRQPPPPGFGGPGPQGGPPGPPQHMGLGPSFSAGNTPLGHPPGIPPNRVGGMGVGGLFQGQGQGGMPGPPQGYFPPPGYGPPPGMGMRGDQDPRLMMGGRPDFEGFGAGGPPQQQGGNGGNGPRQVGRPPGMY